MLGVRGAPSIPQRIDAPVGLQRVNDRIADRLHGRKLAPQRFNQAGVLSENVLHRFHTEVLTPHSRARSMMPVVLTPSRSGRRTTRPPRASTDSRPTTPFSDQS